MINDIFQFSNFLLLIKLINYKTIINYSRIDLHRENGSCFRKGKIRGVHSGRGRGGQYELNPPGKVKTMVPRGFSPHKIVPLDKITKVDHTVFAYFVFVQYRTKIEKKFANFSFFLVDFLEHLEF